MKVLLACECSGVGLDSWLAAGHDAYSCDLQPTASLSKHRHYCGDVRNIDLASFDLVIAHPPCTHLACSGNQYWPQKVMDGRLQEGLRLFFWFIRSSVPRLCVENPVGFVNTWFPPSQIVQPWQFGDNYTKRTCFWLRGLPSLQPLILSCPPGVLRWCPTKGSVGVAELATGLSRSAARSKSFPGITRAMVQQWGSLFV